MKVGRISTLSHNLAILHGSGGLCWLRSMLDVARDDKLMIKMDAMKFFGEGVGGG